MQKWRTSKWQDSGAYLAEGSNLRTSIHTVLTTTGGTHYEVLLRVRDLLIHAQDGKTWVLYSSSLYNITLAYGTSTWLLLFTTRIDHLWKNHWRYGLAC